MPSCLNVTIALSKHVKKIALIYAYKFYVIIAILCYLLNMSLRYTAAIRDK